MIEEHSRAQATRKPVKRAVDAIVVGAGFGGLYAIFRLRQAGFDVMGFEAGSDVGGTWFWNRYPGARCDVPSLEYSYSFSNELQQDWSWPHIYAEQPDILAYLNHVADRFDLRRHIAFGSVVVSQTYDPDTQRWLVKTDLGDEIDAQFCIMAAGNLSIPRKPDFEGLDDFAGEWFQSSRWPGGVDFRGKRVALIGTGATGVQMVPKIASEADHLYVLQRTANYSVPARNVPMSEAMDREHKAEYPRRRDEARNTSWGISGIPAPTRSALDDTPEDREALFEERWRQGGSVNLLTAYTDILLNEEANKAAADFVRRKIREIVKDPKVADLLCPNDHPIGTKRLCVDTDYYETFNEPHVTLVDIRSDPIQRITRSGIATRERHLEVDMILFATGFDAITGSLFNIAIEGKDGQRLSDKWEFGPLTYLGLSTAGFPNLFIVTGPGSPSVKSNMVGSIEQHVDWMADCMTYMARNGFASIEPDPAAEMAWVEHVNAVADATLYPRADSWYMVANAPEGRRVFMPYVGGVPAYRRKCEQVAANAYEGFRLAQLSRERAAHSRVRSKTSANVA